MRSDLNVPWHGESTDSVYNNWRSSAGPSLSFSLLCHPSKLARRVGDDREVAVETSGGAKVL